jgi:hypothetical protein
MNIADSSSWIEYFDDGSLASNFAPIIEDFKSLVVPPTPPGWTQRWATSTPSLRDFWE